MDNLAGFKRTDYCGTLRDADIGREVAVCGWAAKQRDLGSLIFIDLRDRTGIVQLAFGDSTPEDVFKKAFSVRSEFVIAAKGVVRERSSKNSEIPTGNIEVEVSELRILSKSETPPFDIVENCNTSELTRLKYRYLDLRRPDLQKNILFRHKITKIARDYFDENGFIEIETPMLIRSTPEGARDFLVPSRLHNGSFYALPQSPQLYKQLSMVAGFDRYMQIARCFRDEDLRADRQPEFTQIDLEMSFVDMEDVLKVGEGFIARVFKDALGIDIKLPLRRLTYKEAMEKYGSDKPDLRFGMEIFDLSDIVKDCGFSVFSSAIAGGGSVRGITAKNAVGTFTRKELDKLTEHAKGIGAKGLAWIRLTDDGISSSFAKFMSEDEMKAILERAGAEKGDVVMIIADTKNSTVLTTLGALRSESGKRLGIIGDGYELLWIVEFPFFDWDEETKTFVAMHHPFTAPLDECLPYLETDKASVRAKAYDLVLNGIELSSGSIRITDPELQSRIFTLLGLSDEEAYSKFGYLLDAFRFGPPPHGGMGIGLDRLVMQLIKADSLRDVIAFPKVQNASEPMTECPAAVDKVQLDDLGIELKGE
ncbi:MAG: aspartate--tRNA ligase [Oscillospiraceae bacterium]|nr:aspartate--tRNA ligase [Oscillospiraceae bacterium]MDD7470193.1 aspartate--tRNA ligase [Oscillospiraceae bacterium]MDY2677905.1 aspartate--tRNA ligase [Oscillospiraceae bacterium]